MKVSHLAILAAVALFVVAESLAETVYFLAADGAQRESYVVPISDFMDIAHARDLITYGPSIGQTIICADITCEADGINRDHYAPDKRAWNWHITQFSGFADITIEILDGSPSLVEADCDGWVDNTGGQIGFWGFTIVDELGTDPNLFQCNFNRDLTVNLEDFDLFAEQWLQIDCDWPDWCQGADTDQNNVVDLADLQYCVDFWLITFPEPPEPPIWFDAWACPTQCYGNADCTSQPVFPGKLCPVYTEDRSIYLAVWSGGNWPATCDDFNYDPRADFDRDCDVDDDDGIILDTWYGVDESLVSTDCPTQP